MSHTFKTRDRPTGIPGWPEHNEGAYMGMGFTAENVAAKYGHHPPRNGASGAGKSPGKQPPRRTPGGLNRSIIPVTVPGAEGGTETVTLDEGIRRNTTLEGLASLKPCFREDGAVTAATSSSTSDGAAFAVLMSEDKAAALGIKPLARMRSFATGGCDARYMGLGPIYAVPKALARAELTMDDLDVIELNEAFAAQALACIRDLALPVEKVNPWGGAMALGHPMGATGIFLTSKALDYLRLNGGRYALVTMCIGGGMGAAAVFELL